MKSAYNQQWLYNLAVIKEAKRWAKEDLVMPEQLKVIHEQYSVPFYHPNFIIRILLFVATLLALGGVTGLLALMVADIFRDDTAITSACFVYGVISFVVLEVVFISNNNHYKSGVTEALLYHAAGFTIGGFAGILDFDTNALLWSFLMVSTFAAYRYLDLISTIVAVASLGSVLFYYFYMAGGIFQQVIPFVFILVFTPIYFITKKLKANQKFEVWTDNLLVLEGLSLLLIYAAGNYLVVRELSVNLMDLNLEPGDDIPFAFLFYLLTVAMPISYLYFGIKNKDVVLIRVSLIVLAFSVFTFKYYYGFGHPEISLTLAGAIMIGIAIWLLNYLKIMRNGFTRENHLAEKWGNLNLQAFIISQTLGGNEAVIADDQFKGAGGEFGGGGATGNF